jgi:ornithine cyclodeaminase/alanine dehydrogenase-like protein (mu-crystallin family)
MEAESTLLLNRTDVQKLLSLTECVAAVERVFRLQGEGKIPSSGILGVRTQSGGLHVKIACLSGAKNYIVAKLNTNFAQNYARFGLPTIQGAIVLYDADNGRLLAVLDSMEITLKRTAAATAVAAKYLARKNSAVATICGCGEQGRAQVRALSLIFRFGKVYAFDIDSNASLRLATQLSRELNIDVEPVRTVPSAIRTSDVVVTCTPAKEFFVHKKDVAPGTFIAAVGADDSHKNEIDPAVLASAKVVGDSLEQVCSIGDTHHAIVKGLMRKQDVHAELAEVVAGEKTRRTTEAEIIVFDSTGVAIEDAAAAAIVYEKALTIGVGNHFEFAA